MTPKIVSWDSAKAELPDTSSKHTLSAKPVEDSSMSIPSTDLQKIWTKQCEAAEDIRERYGQKSAMDYLIGEKLFRFVAASEYRPEFAAELPAFVNEIRLVFALADIRAYLDHLEHTKILAPEPDLGIGETDDETEEEIWPNNLVLGAEELLRFSRIRQLLQE